MLLFFSVVLHRPVSFAETLKPGQVDTLDFTREFGNLVCIVPLWLEKGRASAIFHPLDEYEYFKLLR